MRFADPQKIIQQFGIVEDMKVADLGSGAGFFSIPIAERVGEDGLVYAVDIRGEVLERLKDVSEREYSLENLEVVKGDLDESHGTALEDFSVDAAILINTLFVIDEKETLAKEVKRILKKDGKLLVVDWSESLGGIGPKEENIVSKEKAKEIFEDAGFSFGREIKAGEYHWGLIFKII